MERSTERGRPNVILVMCDQWQPQCAGYMGHPVVRTPNLDRLAAGGVVFESAYCASPVCSPARASWLTGVYPHAHGVQVNCGSPKPFYRELPRDLPTLGDAFQAAGYRCGLAGPWHLGRDWEPQHGFEDYWEAYRYQRFMGEGRDDPFKEYHRGLGLEYVYGRPKERRHGTAMDPFVIGEVDDPRQQRTNWTMDRGLEFIQGGEGSDDRPFFLFLSIKDPHPAIYVEREFLEFYPEAEIPLPLTWDDPLTGKPAWQRATSRRLPRPGPVDHYRKVAAHYFALITLIDRELGRLIEVLERRGIIEDTLIAFISDHGEMLGAHGMMAKRFFYEEAVRVPTVLSWPGVLSAGQRVKAPLAGVDLAPTLLDLAGVGGLGAIDGRSVASALRDGREPAFRPVLSELGSDAAFDGLTEDAGQLGAHIMVRHGEWKYVWNRYDLDELYSLEEDPGETVNRSGDPAVEEVVHRSRALICEELGRTGPGVFSWCLEAAVD